MALGYRHRLMDSSFYSCRKETDMIDELQASKSCYFYRLKAPITTGAITAFPGD